MTTPDVPAERERDELHERLLAIIESRRMEPWTDKGRPCCVMCGSRWDGEHKAECWVPTLREAAALLAPQEAPTRDQVMPGVFECAKCGCVVQSQTMSVLDGGVVANTEPQRCPNECGPLWPLTYKRAYQTLLDRFPEPAAPQEAREGEAVEAIVREIDGRLVFSCPGCDGEIQTLVVRCDACGWYTKRAGVGVRRAARPAPETEREPEAVGWLVEISDAGGQFNRRVPKQGWWTHREIAEKEAAAWAEDEYDARVRPVYLDAPAPAEATEPGSPIWATCRIAKLAERDFERVNMPEAEATERSES